MEKSFGINFRPKPASFEEHVDRTIQEHLRRRSNENAADSINVTEKTIRNWKTSGLPRAAMRVLSLLQDDPELRRELFDDWRRSA